VGDGGSERAASIQSPRPRRCSSRGTEAVALDDPRGGRHHRTFLRCSSSFARMDVYEVD
jgi:hypothetical protein